MARPTLEFWYEFASTYSYPAAARIERLAAARGITIEWKPFLLGPIFAAQGWNDSPFNVYPAKGRYMWRDLQRICRREGLPFTRPSVFPRNGLLAARVALVAAADGWAAAFTRAVYHANFAEDRDIAGTQTLADIVRALGHEPGAVLERAQSAENKVALKRQTKEAAGGGIFGAPTFLAGDELFWGNDRLEDALDWCATAGAENFDR